MLLADNRASQEGGPPGCVKIIPCENGEEQTLADRLALFDEIGGPRASANYPWWAQADRRPVLPHRCVGVCRLGTIRRAVGTRRHEGRPPVPSPRWILHDEYHHGTSRYRVTAEREVDYGDHVLSLSFQRTGSPRGTAGDVVDGVVVGSGDIASTARYLIGWQGLTLGRDPLSRVSLADDDAFPFTGTLHHGDLRLGAGAEPTNDEPID